MNVSVILGDIGKVPADALITAINSGGMWFGGIDRVITNNAGDMFHTQAGAKLPLSQNDTVVAMQTGQHQGQFKHVVFVVDDLQTPLREVVKSALDAASKAGFKNVSIPTIRMGVMLGQVEKTPEEAVQEMAEGVKLHQASNSNIENITFVTYNDETTRKQLERMFQ